MTVTPVRSDLQSALEAIDGIADLHGLSNERTTGYAVCICHDGAHDPLDRIEGFVAPTLTEARTEHDYVPDSHVIAVERRVITAPAVEVAP